MAELQSEDAAGFRNYFRMDPPMFQQILARIRARIETIPNNYRRHLPPGMRLAITIRYLASGESYHSLMYAFRVAHNTISGVVRQVCEAIIEEYSLEVLACPSTPEEWQVVADLFETKWNFPHACGAIDGKHVAIKNPAKSGSLYYNYKGFYSLLIMAIVDADYKFIWIEVGGNGACSDAQVFNACEVKDACDDGTIGFPQPTPLPDDDVPMPYYFIGDDAFALKTWLMKPFSHRNLINEERIFNYRLSRARRIVENGFGILVHRFRCLLTTMQQEPDTVTSCVMACICLHNLLRAANPSLPPGLVDAEDEQHNLVPGAWRAEADLSDLSTVVGGNFSQKVAKIQRLTLKHYLNSPVGSVPWQINMIP